MLTIETGEIVVDEGTVLDRRKLDEIMDVETNANSEVFELEGSVIDEPVKSNLLKCMCLTMKKVVRLLLSLVMHYLILKLNVLLQQILLPQ